jgi:hypothetical protein
MAIVDYFEQVHLYLHHLIADQQLPDSAQAGLFVLCFLVGWFADYFMTSRMNKMLWN